MVAREPTWPKAWTLAVTVVCPCEAFRNSCQAESRCRVKYAAAVTPRQSSAQNTHKTHSLPALISYFFSLDWDILFPYKLLLFTYLFNFRINVVLQLTLINPVSSGLWMLIVEKLEIFFFKLNGTRMLEQYFFCGFNTSLLCGSVWSHNKTKDVNFNDHWILILSQVPP